METVSKKRGRPPAFDPKYMAALRLIHPHLRSDRQLIAKAYEVRAFGRLCNGGVVIEGVEEIVDLAISRHRSTILEHLGRLAIEGDFTGDETRDIARIINGHIADDKLTVRQAVALLKMARAAIKEDHDGGDSAAAGHVR